MIASVQQPQQLQILLIAESEERNYLLAFKKLINEIPEAKGANIVVTFQSFETRTELDQAAGKFQFVLCAKPSVCKLIAPPQVTFFSAAGSLYRQKYLILPALATLYSVRHGSWLLKRYLSKIFIPSRWIKFPKFTYERVRTHDDFLAAKTFLEACTLIACDIETTKDTLGISCMGFAGLSARGQIRTFVLDCRDEDYLQRLRTLCASGPPKIFQNGLYDLQYLTRWDIPLYNWSLDTAYFFHAWYSELPKDLGFLGSLFLREFEYWKHESGKWKDGGQLGTAGLEEFWRYNAKDCYGTLCTAIAMLSEAPQWAKDNFYVNFPRFFPALFCSLHGIRANKEVLASSLAEAQAKLSAYENSLQTMVHLKTFNAGSPKQVKGLLSLFGLGDFDTDEITLKKLSARHPLLERILDKVIEVREQKKAISTYFTPDIFEERILYNLNPAGTDTGRFASQRSAFWCGLQIQNVPPYAKGYFEAEEGFVFVEVDKERSETHCTAHLSQDANLLKICADRDKDFHIWNASQFFGRNYEELRKECKEWKPGPFATTPEHPLRYLAKRINHAVSYNMGAQVFIDTVGPKMMEEIRELCKFSKLLTHKDIAQTLINHWDRQYPRVRNEFQKEVIKEISFTGRLRGPTGWTRFFFANPNSSKHALNSAVAHGPQCLSVQIVNDGFLRTFREVQLKEEHTQNFRLIAQIHDSILFQCRAGTEEKYSKLVMDCMDIGVKVHGRELRIPSATKILGQFWGKHKDPPARANS